MESNHCCAVHSIVGGFHWYHGLDREEILVLWQPGLKLQRGMSQQVVEEHQRVSTAQLHLDQVEHHILESGKAWGLKLWVCELLLHGTLPQPVDPKDSTPNC